MLMERLLMKQITLMPPRASVVEGGLGKHPVWQQSGSVAASSAPKQDCQKR